MSPFRTLCRRLGTSLAADVLSAVMFLARLARPKLWRTEKWVAYILASRPMARTAYPSTSPSIQASHRLGEDIKHYLQQTRLPGALDSLKQWQVSLVRQHIMD